MSEYNLIWGESVAIRQQFIAGIDPFALATKSRFDLMSMNYPPFEGDAKLIEHTRAVIKRQVNREYKHVILVNGAAGGCVIAMRAYHSMGYKTAWTYEAPFFSLYPSMIGASGLTHIHASIFPALANPSDCHSPIVLVDSPSNPAGIIRQAPISRLQTPVIWDAVYGNRVYAKITTTIPHDVLVGSYSKLTGLNGIRIGWIGTDDDALFAEVKRLVAAEYCGLSVPSTDLLNTILPNYDWEKFEFMANMAMDLNREEWSKLEKFFGGKEVSQNGMFYYAEMDSKAKELFQKAGIAWSPGSNLGHDDSHGRFNIGQSNSLIKNAVANVLKVDKLPR